MKIRSKVEMLEKKIGIDLLENQNEVRSIVEWELDLGLIDLSEFENRMEYYMKEGLTIEKILKEVNGATRGLPSRSALSLMNRRGERV